MAVLGAERATVQIPFIRYVTEIGWSHVPRDEALTLRRGESGTLFYSLLREKLIELNPGLVSVENGGSLAAKIEGARSSIEGNAEVLAWLRGQRLVFDERERRQRNVVVVDFENPSRNRFQVTEEWQYTNGLYRNRADVMFLINGVPVALVETKSVKKRDGIERALRQMRRYHLETPELVTAPQVFDVTHLLDFWYGPTWSLDRKSLFNWRDEEPGNFERKVKMFFARERFLRMLREWILFFTKNDELQKVILRQHQTRAVERTVERSLDPGKRRGLVWHTQGSGKTLTMMAAARRILENPAFGKPTVLMLVDRTELEGQLFANLQAHGFAFARADSKERLREILRSDFRGLVVSMIHKFEGADADLCMRENVYVLVDEAHRSTGGNLGNYLLAALPNATVIGFTGTPIDRTAHGEGTFKVFGREDPQGYLDKYSIAESITDGTTVKLHYALAPNEIRVPTDLLDREFLSLTEAEGVSDIAELDRILDRAVQLKTFLKARDRVDRVAKFVSVDFREKVEPLGYKAFVVAVDREACAAYKRALDHHLESGESAVVYTAGDDDPPEMTRYHLSEEREKEIRARFLRPGQDPKILIVTEKLLTGFDAPLLYCMYLDKPMRDHALLQAIARVNRPYEDAAGRKKPAGLVVDFVGIFERLEKALAFDSDVVSGVIEGIEVLQERFQKLMRETAPKYLALVRGRMDDKAVEKAIEALAERDERETFFRFYRELEALYEILSPDAALRPFLEDYKSLSDLYQVVRNQFNPEPTFVYDLAEKTKSLVQEETSSYGLAGALPPVEIDERTLEVLAKRFASPRAKVLNLGRSLARSAADNREEQPYLMALGARAEAVLEALDERQVTTQDALRELEDLHAQFLALERERDDLGLDPASFSIYQVVKDTGADRPREMAAALGATLARYPHQAQNADERRALKADLYRQLLPVVDKDRMVQVVEAVLAVSQT